MTHTAGTWTHIGDVAKRVVARIPKPFSSDIHEHWPEDSWQPLGAVANRVLAHLKPEIMNEAADSGDGRVAA